MVPGFCLLGRGVGRNTVWVREERNSAGGLTVTTGTRESVAMRSVLLKIWWLTCAEQTMMLDRRRVEVVCWVTMDHYHKQLLQEQRICTDWCGVNFISQLPLR